MQSLTGLDGVVLMGHGSRDPAGAEEFLALSNAVASTPPLHGVPVKPGWLEFAGGGAVERSADAEKVGDVRVESIQQAFGRLVEGGAQRIAALPLILFAAGHGAEDMPAQVRLALQRYPSVDIRMAELIGIDDCLLAGLAARARAATCDLPEVPSQQTAVLLITSGSKSREANADVFKAARLLSDHVDAAIMEVAFLRLARPFVQDAVQRCGAGSPAEINLRARDIVNMRVALHASAEVLLVGDIDRGGVFAALLGTWEWLTVAERALVHGFVLNKFRGDAALLAPAPALLEERTGVPVRGVVPYIENLLLPEEDGASLTQRNVTDGFVDIAIIRLPYLANFDEFGALAAKPGVHVRYVSQPAELRAPDLVILPGTKATIPDLLWLSECGLADRIRWLAAHGTPILGICGGYQMLGNAVHDPGGVESAHRTAPGLGMLPVYTELATEKRLVRTRGRVLEHGFGVWVWSCLAGLPIDGYEIHLGRLRVLAENLPFIEVEAGPEGSVTADAPVVGTHLHGLLEQPAPRYALVHALAEARGFGWQSGAAPAFDPFDALADVLETTLRLDGLRVSSIAPC